MNRFISANAMLSVLVATSFAFTGCEKNASTDDTAEPATEVAAEPAAAKVAEQPAAAKVAAEPTQTAAVDKADEDYSCAGDKDKAVAESDEPSCGSMKDKEVGGCNKWDEAAAEVIERDVPENATWTTLKVAGMTCGGCERRVIAKLGALDGVFSVEADAEMGQVRVAMDKSKPKLASVAAEAISALGYRVQ